MTQLIVSSDEVEANAKTLQAMREVENGDTVVCDTMVDYLKLIGYGVQD